MNKEQQKTKSNIFLDIFCRIWAIWGLVLFIATMPIALVFYLPCFVLNDPYKAVWHRHVSRVWMFCFLNLIGCPFSIKGRECYAKHTNYVVVCNHNSLMDIPVSTPFMERPNKTIAKKSLSKIPVFGWIYSFGSVLVDRKSDASRRKSYDQMKQKLQLGLDMVIYPEGTRNRTGDPLKSFYDGAFKLSTDTGKPIMPVLLFNTAKILPASRLLYLRPHRIEMHYLDPISPEGLTAQALKEIVYKKMWDYYTAHA